MKKKEFLPVILPKNLRLAIGSLGLSKIQTDKAYQIVNIIIGKTIYKDIKYHQLSAKYFRMVIGSHYYKALTPLVESGILKQSGYDVEKGRCCAYALSEDLYKGDVTLVNIKARKYNRVNLITPEEREQILRFLNSLVIDFQAIQNEIEERLKYEKDTYKETHYNRCLLKLKKKLWFVTKNDKNNRIDHNLTNCPSFFIKHMSAGGKKLCEIDLANSQFAHLAWIIDQINKGEDMSEIIGYDFADKSIEIKDDLVEFLDSAKKGTLYEEVSSQTEKTREAAKKTMFEINFSSSRCNTESKKDFRDTFGETFSAIKGIKKHIGDKGEFAISLQRAEAYIFIKNIFANLIKENINCITKHDSVIFAEPDLERVRTIIDSKMNELNFVAKKHEGILTHSK